MNTIMEDILNGYVLQVVIFVCINIILAMTIYMTLCTGLLSLGNAGFMSLGAYTSAILTVQYQLPMPLCQMFIKEIFDGKSPDEFDEETLSTINKFFENSLNVSETSRQLYIHRNTLVYRLDKLQKSTGLDLRIFDDAITFKIALMVVKYMKYMESIDTF